MRMRILSFLDGPWAQYEFFGNTMLSYLQAAGLAVGMVVLLFLVHRFVAWRTRSFASRSSNTMDDALVELIESITPLVYTTLAVYLGVRTLTLPSLLTDIVEGVVLAAVIYQIIALLQILLDRVFRRVLVQRIGGGEEEAALGLLRRVSSWVLWVLGALVVVQNFGINVTSLVAGLGIGGIAVALAAQNVLADLFSSFSIIFDKPFKVGDFIVVGTDAGTVRHVGMKTTRMQSLDGEEIVLSNQELTNARVQNYGRMEERRVAFDIGVVYETSQSNLEKIPAIIEEVVGGVEGARFGRSHFKAFGDFALVFETVFFITSGNYDEYMDAQQNILLEVKRRFDEEGIAFAYPTQTVLLQRS